MGMEQGGYTTDAGGGNQGSYGYGGGGDFNLSMGAGGDDYSIDLGGGIDFGDADFHYGYGFDTGTEYGDSSYSPGGGSLFDAYTDYYLQNGIDELIAMELAAQDVAAGSIETVTSERGLLPDASLPSIPMTPFLDPFPIAPYVPAFPDLPAPLPPIVTPVFPLVAPPVPQVTQTPTVSGDTIPIAPGLPPACPTGQYHPFPIGHQDQNKCVPFPPAQTGSRSQQQQQQQSSARGGASTGGGSSQQKPPTQQQQQPKCPTGYYRDPATGQCKPIPSGQPQQCPTGYYRASNGQCLPIPRCTTPGTVFDQARGLCVPQGQAISPVSEGGVFDDLLSNLKDLPWWIWLALGGLILLSRDEDGKRTTVTYRRAR